MEQIPVLTRIKWTLDPSHSHIGFKVKHLMVSNIRGGFTDYKGDIFSNKQDFSDADIAVSINPASITTGEPKRDGALKSSDFFDVDNFNEIQFKGDSLEKIDESKYVLHGDLTIKATT